MRHVLSLGIAFCAAVMRFRFRSRLAAFSANLVCGALALLAVVLIPALARESWCQALDSARNLESAAIRANESRVCAVRPNFTVRKQDYMNHFAKVSFQWHS